MLPWAIAVTRIGMTPDNAWKYHRYIFGGSLVFSFVDVAIVVAAWAWMMTRGKIALPRLVNSISYFVRKLLPYIGVDPLVYRPMIRSGNYRVSEVYLFGMEH